MEAANEDRASKTKIQVGPAVNVRYVLLHVFCALTGYTEKAARRKIEEGIWIDGRHFRKAPDGRITMDMEGYQRWVEGDRAAA